MLSFCYDIIGIGNFKSLNTVNSCIILIILVILADFDNFFSFQLCIANPDSEGESCRLQNTEVHTCI